MLRNYERVLPRDLFNEGNLLKCYGALWIELERYSNYAVIKEESVSKFVIRQDDSDGSLTIANVTLMIAGKCYLLRRPLNSREPYPLYLTHGDVDIPIFNDNGTLSADLLEFIGAA